MLLSSQMQNKRNMEGEADSKDIDLNLMKQILEREWQI